MANSNTDKIAETQQSKVSSPFSTMVKPADLKKLAYQVTSASICDTKLLEDVSKEFKAAGVTSDKLFHVAFDLARHCADVGTSEFTTPIGQSNHCGLQRSEVAALVKTKTTLRRFCAYFAKYVWNHMLMNDTPPANYCRKGFKESNKFAAFDTFFAVTSDAALEPNGGLVRMPTQAEMAANVSFAEVAIFRQVALNGNQNLNVGEITSGLNGNKMLCPLNGRT
jgi:hypothetical protein